MSEQESPTVTNTRERILDATIEVVAEDGFGRATTRSISINAGVAEVTLFRLFKSKANLIVEVFLNLTNSYQEAALSPTGNLEQDLQRVAEQYYRLARRNRKLILRMLPEVAYNVTLRKASLPLRQKVMTSLRSLFAHYQNEGQFPGRNLDDLMAAFMGPMVGKIFLMGEVFDVETHFDAAQHVNDFLYGVSQGESPSPS
ncbi:TetR/AcrR family transcriptional regulator [Deinococcus multiflagellatus]|uniref:TetR/AcrR family transcriptional regulator n=1 Tax=Deinococcus multiflagellatus TaxID=1656887 RepID=A0ABW1ZS16_9DEIO|nr:TetR/AcrR family transcriptional regulator [Deinococcus multiflagellatus]MBZ9716128.1 TetR/AcrR family transcriptional regulator [Deinococcus multiflagellatus]